jgi:signal transduction histidine kinase/ligand-binding sensor domain-containing protein
MVEVRQRGAFNLLPMTWRTSGFTFVYALALLAWCCPTSALNAEFDVDQYAHTAWKYYEGPVRGVVSAIAQTQDGYLWLGTWTGLLRFDGVRTILWQPPAGQPLPDQRIRYLLAGRDGSLWIGTWEGLFHWTGERLESYPQLTGQYVNSVLQDRKGTIWVAAMAHNPDLRGVLCAIQGGDVHCESGGMDEVIASLYEDSRGQVWASGLSKGLSKLWRVPLGSSLPHVLSRAPGGTTHVLAEDTDGSLLVLTRGAVIRFKDDTETLAYPLPPDSTASVLFRDHDGAIWIGDYGGGVLHIHHGRLDTYGKRDGLSGEAVTAFFEDREGNVWVATPDGLDRFHDVAAVTHSIRHGLSNAAVAAVLAAADGSIWVTTRNGLDRLHNGGWEIYRQDEPGQTKLGLRSLPSLGNREIAVAGLPKSLGSLFEDNQGRIWITSTTSIGWLDKRRYFNMSGVAGGNVDAIGQDTAESLWLAHRELGLLRLSQEGAIQRTPWVQLSSRGSASRLAVDPRDGSLWLGFSAGGIAHLVSGHVQKTYLAADGLAKGDISQLHVDPDGTVWVGAQGGLSRLTSGRIATLDHGNGLPCESVEWMMTDDTRAVWLRTPCGLVRIIRSELDAWTTAAAQGKGAKRRIVTTLFDSADGVRMEESPSTYSPHVAKTPDGRLWFVTSNGIGEIDPHHLARNVRPPPVRIEELVADHRTYETAADIRLPPLTRDLEIHFTALSLVAPEKNEFQYKLAGHDREWVAAGSRRSAFYTDLPPGNYRFRVIASNNSGVWNSRGATLDFSIAPAFWQTLWFRALCVAAILAFLWMLYWLRMRQLAHEFDMKVGARVDERTRIARELHDTLLQSFNGLLLRFRTVHALFSKSPDEARKILEDAIGEAREALTEGRQAVQGLRSSAVETHEFSEAIRTLTEELARDPTHGGTTDARLRIEGTSRRLRPLMRDEIYRIAGEALRNAFRHAEASRIEVQLRYDEGSFELRVRDDGKGIDPKFVAEEIPGHFGLRGMRERAERTGGKLTVWSAPGSGTEVLLSVPAAAVYATDESAARSWLGRKISRGFDRSHEH